MKSIVALLLLVAAGSAAATAGTWDFFPHNVHLNCTDFGDCSTPSAWSLANQTAYAAELPSSDALVGGGAGLLTIAVHTYNAGEATLYFQPGAWCDTVGAAIPLEVMQGLIEGTPPPSRRRALLLARGASGGSGRIASRAMLQAAEVVDTATPVAGPPPAEFEVSRACGVAQVAYAVDGGGAATPLPVFNEQAGVYKLELPAGLPDGEHCLTITATFATGPGSFATTPDYAAALGVALPDTQAVNRTVCVLKVNSQADATVAFDMCSTNQFTVNVSSFTPLPVNVTLNGAPIGDGAPLVRPLVKVFGARIAALDGTPADTAYDAAAQSGEGWVSKFVALPASYDGGAVSVPLSAALAEGYYNLTAVASVVTAFPRLVDAAGLNRIEQSDATGAEAGVSGLYEAATAVLFEGKVVGLQRASTPTTLSAISCTSHAPKQAVAAGDAVTLAWQFNGAGNATCTHDGAPVSNAPNGACASPLTVTALPFGAGAAASHAVVVAFTDVCGRRRTAEFSYAAAGVTAVTPPEVLNDDGTVTVAGAPVAAVGVNRTNGAGAARALKGGIAGALGAGALLAAALL